MRTYDCGDCDFHIAGPADEVADEIDAHEEQHHTDAAAVSGIEVTPDVLRAVAGWIFDTALPASFAHALVDAARQMEREQADEQRIDELAEIHWTAVDEAGIGGMEWGDLTPLQRAAERAGIRAVLAKLDEDRNRDATESTSGNAGNAQVNDSRDEPDQWDTLADVPDHIDGVYRTTGGSATFHRRDGKWFEQLGTLPDVYVAAGLIGPFREIPF